MNLGDVGRSVGNRVLESMGRAASRVQETRPLPTDVLESDDAYLVVFDAPGATQSDVQVRYANDGVEVRIDRFREFYDDDMRIPGRGMSLDGRAELPADAVVNPTAATATLRSNGTLEVSVPKTDRDGDDHGAEGRDAADRDAEDRDASSGTVEIDTPSDDDDSTPERDADATDDDTADATDDDPER